MRLTGDLLESQLLGTTPFADETKGFGWTHCRAKVVEQCMLPAKKSATDTSQTMQHAT